jgi:hypothetical protein
MHARIRKVGRGHGIGSTCNVYADAVLLFLRSFLGRFAPSAQATLASLASIGCYKSK